MADDPNWNEIEQARTAPAGMFRVLAVDTWSPPGEHWGVGDYATMAEAVAVSDARAAKDVGSTDPYTKYYVYDDQGAFRHEGRAR